MYELFVNLGFDNFVKMSRILAILPVNNKTNKNMYYGLKKDGKIIDFTRGRKHKSLVLLDNEECCVSAFPPRVILDAIEKRLEFLEGELEMIEDIQRIGDNIG